MRFDELLSRLSEPGRTPVSEREMIAALDSVPVKERPKTWVQLTPERLSRLPVDPMEALLDRLPQCGALLGRERGKLRVLSMGFNVHIGGTDKRCEFPIDFCVRINGEKAAVNVLIRPVPDKFSLDMLDGLETGPKQSFFTIMCALANRGLDRLRYYELALLRIFRPASPGGYQYGTAGGVFEGAHDTARERTFQETREEFKGFEYLGWDLLLAEQVYQSGNIYELQSVGVVIGHIPNPEAVQTEKAEGIEDWKTVPLDTAFNFFDELRRVPLTDPHCIRHDGKIDHGLARLLPRLAKIGIT